MKQQLVDREDQLSTWDAIIPVNNLHHTGAVHLLSRDGKWLGDWLLLESPTNPMNTMGTNLSDPFTPDLACVLHILCKWRITPPPEAVAL